MSSFVVGGGEGGGGESTGIYLLFDNIAERAIRACQNQISSPPEIIGTQLKCISSCGLPRSVPATRFEAQPGQVSQLPMSPTDVIAVATN